MSAPRRATLFLHRLGLGALLLGAIAVAQPVSGLRTEPLNRGLPKRSAPDSGQGLEANIAGLSAEDREVVENLELLENLEQSDNLELLVELSKED